MRAETRDVYAQSFSVIAMVKSRKYECWVFGEAKLLVEPAP